MNWKMWLLLILSSVFLAGTTCLNYDALTQIPPVDAIALHYVQPVYTLILGAILLKERFKIYHFILIISIVVSVFLVCQPDFIFGSTESFSSTIKVIASIEAAASGFCATLVIITVRFLKDLNSNTIIYVQSIVICAGLLIIFSTQMGTPRSIRTILIIIAVTFFGGTGRFFVTLALKKETAAIVSACLPMELVFTAILQIFLIKVIPNWLAIIGSVILFTSVVLLPLHDQVMNLFSCKRNHSAEETQKILPK